MTDMNQKNSSTQSANRNSNRNPNPERSADRITLDGPPRASAAAIEELKWFFDCARAEIEASSNYERMVRRMAYGEPLTEDTEQYDTGAERRAEALHAARAIYERIMSLDSYERWVLRMLFDPPEGEPVLTAVVAVAPHALAAYEKTRVGFPGSVVPEPEVGR